MRRHAVLVTITLGTLSAAPVSGQANTFDFGVHFGASVQQVVDGGDGWLGGIQAALAIDDRFDFYPGLSFSGNGDALRPLLAVRAWPLGRAEKSFAGWYLGAGMLADQATFLTGVQIGSRGVRPFLQAQVVSPEDLHVLLGFAVRVK